MLAGSPIASIIIVIVLLVALYKIYYNRSWGWKFVWVLVALWMLTSLKTLRGIQSAPPV